MGRTILHSDLNNFYASVECLYHPELREKPIAVCGDVEERHGIVLAKNNIAKALGIQTGEVIWQAKQKCSELCVLPPNYDRYLQFSRLARTIYESYTDRVEAFGLDECWLDVSDSRGLFGDGKTIANEIRRRIKQEMGVTASIGVSFNKIFAKLGSDMKKPDATTVVHEKDYKEKIWPLPVKELLYVGHATERKLGRLGIKTIGQLATMKVDYLYSLLGKNGIVLWQFANGKDSAPVKKIGMKAFIKSIGNSTTAPRDLVHEEEIKITLYILAESVAERLREQNFKARMISISIRDNTLFSYSRQGQLTYPTCISNDIFLKAFQLYQKNHMEGRPIRSIGIKAGKLEVGVDEQLSFLPELERIQQQQMLECSIDDIRRRFGHFSVRRGIMLQDMSLSKLDPKGEHVIYPVSFFG